MGREGGWTTAGTFTSYRCGYDVSFWGEHQFNFLALVEVQPSVRMIHARPEELEWFDGNRWRVHVPDFLVRTDRGSSMFDIEEHGREKAPAARVMSRSLRISLAERGIGYRMLSAKPLSANPRLSNATLVNASAWNRLPEEFVGDVELEMPSAGASSREIARTMNADPREVLTAALHLMWHGRLAADIGKEIDVDAVFRRARP
jgi:hypothetical protein